MRTTLATIRFHLPADALERVSFAYGPWQEAVFSVHVLVEPQRHPLHHPFIRRMRALPVSLRREMSALSFAFGAAPPGLGVILPDPLVRVPADTAETFHQVLEEVRALPEDTAAAGLADPVRIAAQHRLSDGSAVRMALEEPVAFFNRLCHVLSDYWDAAFEQEWQRWEPHLADSVAEAGRQLLEGGLPAFVRTLGPRVRAHSEGEGFDLDMTCAPQWGGSADQTNLEIEVTDDFTFVPSAFSWPHIWYAVTQPWPMGMTYHAPAVAMMASTPVPPPDLVGMLRACADDVRMHALRLIADRPRSTQELAPLVGVAEATLSKHLRHLTDAGILATRRDGHYVLYHLRRDRLVSMTTTLLTFLDADGEQKALGPEVA